MRYFVNLLLLCLICLPFSAAQGHTDLEPGLSLTASWTSTGSDTNAQLGTALGIDGDFNGDGWKDLYVGAPKAEKDVYREGVVSVYYGSMMGLPISAQWTQGGGQQGAGFGGSLASVGDVNGDGRDDLLVGASGYSDKANKLTEQGAVYLYLGGVPGLSDTPIWSYFGGQQDALLGVSVNMAGDVNGDGIKDAIVGASHFMNTFQNEGAVYVFYGNGTSLNPLPDWTAFGGLATAGFGASVAAAGDVNADGYDDVIIGAPGYDLPGQTNCGAAFIFLGSNSGLQPTPAWSFFGETAEAQFGSAVSGAGDTNQDGFADFLVGAPKHSSLEFPLEGAAYLFLGSGSALATAPHWQRYGGQENANLGVSLAAVGDLNQDTYADIAVGAHRYTDDHNEEGRAYVFYGSASGLLNLPSWWADGNKAEATFGQVLSRGSDLNKDGFIDLAIGAPSYKAGGDIVGRAFVFYGTPEAQTPSITKFVYLPVMIAP